MENADLADFLDLDEREEGASLQFGRAECLAKVGSILEKVEEASVHVQEDSDDRSHYELAFAHFFLEECGVLLAELL